MYNATLNFAAPFDGVASVVLLLGLTAAASVTMKASSIPSSKQFAPPPSPPPLLFIASISHKSSTGAEIGFSNARHLFSASLPLTDPPI